MRGGNVYVFEMKRKPGMSVATRKYEGGCERPRRQAEIPGGDAVETGFHIAAAEMHHRSRMAVVPLLSPVWPPPHVSALFTAMIARAAGELACQLTAESTLVQLAEAAGANFEEELIARMVDWLTHSLPGASRDEAERAVRIDVMRHVTRPLRLMGYEPWGSA